MRGGSPDSHVCSALSEYEHKMQRQREDSASLLSDVAELSETIKLRDMTCSDLTRREKELLGKLDEQTKLNANLEVCSIVLLRNSR